MSRIAFTMLILLVYMLLFENRKFVVMFSIFVNSQNMIKSGYFYTMRSNNFSTVWQFFRIFGVTEV